MISDSRILKGVVSSNENTPILHGETTVLGLVTEVKNIEKDKIEGFNFSTIQVIKDNEVAQLDLAPYINFLKGDFLFPSVKEGVKLKNDVIVIIWRTKTGRFGISHALIVNDDTINSDVVDSGDVFSSTDSVDSPTVPVVKKPCRVRAVVSSKNIQVSGSDFLLKTTIVFFFFKFWPSVEKRSTFYIHEIFINYNDTIQLPTGCGICLSTTLGHSSGLDIEISKILLYTHKLIIFI